MKHIIKLFILLLIFSFLFIKSGIYKNVLGVGTAFAVGDLTVNWGVIPGDPIFTLSGMAPGDTETHTVNVTNGAVVERSVGVSGLRTLETGELSKALTMTISHNGSDIYGGTLGEKTLHDFLTESTLPNHSMLTSLPAGENAEYVFTVTFRESAGNEFQDKTIKFDLIIGLAVDVPQACQNIVFNGHIINGTASNDSLIGTANNDLILSLDGNDRIVSGNGNDCIVSGDGADQIIGGNGDDVIDTGAGNDRIAGENGSDTIFAGANNDTIDGGNGTDSIFGGAGTDTLSGSNGNDSLDGETGADTAVGGGGVDTCTAETEIQCEL